MEDKVSRFLDDLRDLFPEESISVTPISINTNGWSMKKIIFNGHIINADIEVNSFNQQEEKDYKEWLRLYEHHITTTLVGKYTYSSLGQQIAIIKKEIYEDPFNITL